LVDLEIHGGDCGATFALTVEEGPLKLVIGSEESVAMRNLGLVSGGGGATATTPREALTVLTLSISLRPYVFRVLKFTGLRALGDKSGTSPTQVPVSWPPSVAAVVETVFARISKAADMGMAVEYLLTRI